jgi:NAD dependent epimerase/dehydratase family enzyme
MGIVLGRQDGAFPRILNLVKAGLGGQQGNGRQYMSWIHEQDAARCTAWLLQQQQLEGVFNCTAPEPIQNAAFMRLVRTAYGIPIGIPAPQWLLELGALLIGTETELLLKSRWVIPKRLLEEGFTFQFEKAAHAIHDILSIRI